MTISSTRDFEGMRAVGLLVALAIKEMKAALAPGLTTGELDAVGERFLRGHGARSAPQFTYNFPGFTLISVNEEIVHGIPGRRVIRAGDVVKIDVTAELGGYIADSAATVALAPYRPRARELVRCAHAAFDAALGSAHAGAPVAAIGRAVEGEVRRHGFHVIRSLTGHGVGRAIHEEPSIPNHYSPHTRGTLTEGLVIAIEPMVSVERADVVEEKDGWTLRTHNRSLAAHYEHTVMISGQRPLILTAA